MMLDCTFDGDQYIITDVESGLILGTGEQIDVAWCSAANRLNEKLDDVKRVASFNP